MYYHKRYYSLGERIILEEEYMLAGFSISISGFKRSVGLLSGIDNHHHILFQIHTYGTLQCMGGGIMLIRKKFLHNIKKNSQQTSREIRP